MTMCWHILQEFNHNNIISNPSLLRGHAHAQKFPHLDYIVRYDSLKIIFVYRSLKISSICLYASTYLFPILVVLNICNFEEELLTLSTRSRSWRNRTYCPVFSEPRLHLYFIWVFKDPFSHVSKIFSRISIQSRFPQPVTLCFEILSMICNFHYIATYSWYDLLLSYISNLRLL